MKKRNIEDELPPFLQDLKSKGDGMKAPEGYFDDMEDAVFTRLKASGDLDRPTLIVTKRPGLFARFVRPQAMMAYAAALALILVAAWFIRQPGSVGPGTSIASTELTEDDIEAYVLENVQEFEPEQLVALNEEEPSEATDKNTPQTNKKNKPSIDEIHPDDLNQILDEMTDEELEQIL